MGTFEDYGQLLNAAESGDLPEAREMAIWFTTGAVRALHCLHAQVVDTGRRLFIEARSLGPIGRELSSLRYESHGAAETARRARRIWTALIAGVEAAGVTLPDFPDS